MAKKCNVLKDLRVNEVSLVTKGANGVEFDIIKSAEGSPVDTLISLMTNPDTMDDVDKETLSDLGEEAYATYVNEFATEFISDLESQGEDVQKFIDEMVNEKSGGNKEEAPKEKEEALVPEKVAPEKDKVKKSFGDVVKSIFGKDDINKEDDKEESEEDNEEEDGDMEAEKMAEIIAKALEPVAKSVTELTEKVTKMESAKEEAEKVKEEEEVEEVKKADEVDVIAEAIAKALEPITKSMSDTSERLSKIEKQEMPSGKIMGQDNITKSNESKPKWGSFDIKGGK